MNRLQSPKALAESTSKHAVGLGSPVSLGLYQPTRGEVGYSLFAPLHYEANYAYPTLVWLHGPGDDENQLKRIMPLVSLRNYLAIAPRGTVEWAASCRTTGRRSAGFGWSQEQTHVTLAEQRVFEAIEGAQSRFNLHPERVYLAGFDLGGTMAFRLAMDHPQRFAGVLSLGGEFPKSRRPLRRLAEARRLSLFLACARDSDRYPAERVCENLKLFHAAGMSVTLRQYPCGHEIDPRMLSDMDHWLMEQVTGQPCTG